MYKVIIADDEPSVITSLQSSIKWEELNLEVVGIAKNGKEALEKIEREDIDIAILDIRMPGIGGLEVCERIHHIRESLQIIIISGYAEFSYAERAIRYGVLGYCLKPLEYDKITRLLLKAVNNCEKRMEGPRTMDLLEALERKDRKAIIQTLSMVGFDCDKIYVTVSVGEEKIPAESEKIFVVELGREQYGYLSGKPLELKQMERSVLAGNILGIGYASEPVDAGRIPEVIEVCLTKAFQYFVDFGQRVCGNLDTGKAAAHLEKFRTCLSKDKWDIIIEELKNLEGDDRKDFTIRSALKLCNMIHSGSLFREVENDYYIYSLRQLTAEYQTIHKMFRRLQQEIREEKEQQKTLLEHTNSAFIELMTYIQENYKKDISLSSASQNCHMSANYVSQLFKKETGMNFIHYITQLRMEEAVNLLQTTRKSAAEISSEVGYNDYFYFLKTFKKYTGKTLSQYRAEL